MCGLQNAHIGRISWHWAEPDQKPRIVAIKSILAKAGYTAPAAHIEIVHGQASLLLSGGNLPAILEYYGFEAGANCQPQARDNFRVLAGSKLREMIFSSLGYHPAGADTHKFEKWHERIALNYGLKRCRAERWGGPFTIAGAAPNEFTERFTSSSC